LYYKLAYKLSIMVMSALIFFLYLTPSQGRELVGYFITDLGKPIHKQYYDKHCEITFENVYNDFFDIYSCSHFVGWFLLSLITRNFVLLTLWQLQDEIIELSYSYIYPVFNVCKN